MKPIIGFLLFVLIFVGFVYSMVFLLGFRIAPVLSSYDFCEDMGYDTITLAGHYVPYKNKDYGKVSCLAYYADGNERRSFNVTEDWRGKLTKHDVYQDK